MLTFSTVEMVTVEINGGLVGRATSYHGKASSSRRRRAVAAGLGEERREEFGRGIEIFLTGREDKGVSGEDDCGMAKLSFSVIALGLRGSQSVSRELRVWMVG